MQIIRNRSSNTEEAKLNSKVFLLARYELVELETIVIYYFPPFIVTVSLTFVQMQVMKASKGKANPGLLNKILLEKLNS